jgi:hypothetical protein
MHKWHPYFCSSAWPRRWALECQKAILPRGSEKSNSSSSQSDSKARVRSINYADSSECSSQASIQPSSKEKEGLDVYFTEATKQFSKRRFEIFFA